MRASANAQAPPLRRPGWRTLRPTTFEDTKGRALLTSLARRIASNAPGVVRRRVIVQHSCVQRDAYRDAPDDRAWRGESQGRDIWCIIDARSQRGLLEFVLAGPGAPSPTSVERSIVAESVCRLFETASAAHSGMCEERTRRPPPADLCRCNVDLIDAVNRTVTLQLLTPIVEPQPPPKAAVSAGLDIGRVRIPLAASLDPLGVRLNELVRWAPGSLVDLDACAADLRVRVNAGAKALAWGAFGSVGSHRAVRITSVAAPADS